MEIYYELAHIYILAIQYCTAISTDSKGVHTHAAATWCQEYIRDKSVQLRTSRV